jgi:hypothetical protein
MTAFTTLATVPPLACAAAAPCAAAASCENTAADEAEPCAAEPCALLLALPPLALLLPALPLPSWPARLFVSSASKADVPPEPPASLPDAPAAVAALPQALDDASAPDDAADDAVAAADELAALKPYSFTGTRAWISVNLLWMNPDMLLLSIQTSGAAASTSLYLISGRLGTTFSAPASPRPHWPYARLARLARLGRIGRTPARPHGRCEPVPISATCLWRAIPVQ